VAVSAASRRLHLGEGSVIGGRVGLFIAPDLLGALAGGRRVALVSGTNGKTTTTRLLTAALGGSEAVATSAAGANLPPGLAVALASSAPGSPAVLEVDEGYLGRVAGSVHPEVVVLLNLSRDQLDRVSEVRMVSARWRSALSSESADCVVANADDPLVAWGAQGAARVVWVAAGQLWRQDSVGCPACEGRIVFSETGDDWWCGCGFRRPVPDAALAGDELVTTDGRRLAIALALPGRANRANAAMAAVAAGLLGVDAADALAAMAGIAEVEGRYGTVEVDGTAVRMLLAKNPAGWTELLDMLEGGHDPVVIGINARTADGHDPSWLWDVPFERLTGRAVVATGERCRDLAVRLRHGGVAHLTVPDQLDALGALGVARLEYVGNYTAFQAARRRVTRAEPAALRTQGDVDDVVPAPAPGMPVAVTPAPGTSGNGPPRNARGGTAVRDSALRVVVVHPDLLGTYGDSGNGRVLAGRAVWRDMAVELVHAPSDRPLPATADIYCLGGGEDGPQVQSAQRLRAGGLSSAVEGGAVVFAVCAGYQVIGRSFPDADGRQHRGVELLDVVTVKGTGRRAVGELAGDPRGVDTYGAGDPLPLGTLTGFENHSSVTRVGSEARPLARVLTGVGNGAGDGCDGARRGRVLGTYMHGPALARNPALADLLLALATGLVPDPLDDSEEKALRVERLAALPGPHRNRIDTADRDGWQRIGNLVRTRRA
jgi:CobQ-like glutamine amidotransferase family enzyme/UDP-N-acetylmuramyl tripeptide synthase